MLNRGDDEVAASFLRSGGDASDGEVIRFAPAPGEDDFSWSRPQHRGQLVTGRIDQGSGCAAVSMDAGGVTENSGEGWGHCLQHLGPERGGRGVVQVDRRRHRPHAAGVSRWRALGAEL